METPTASEKTKRDCGPWDLESQASAGRNSDGRRGNLFEGHCPACIRDTGEHKRGGDTAGTRARDCGKSTPAERPGTARFKSSCHSCISELRAAGWKSLH